jgi:hypothetical protein
MRNDTQVTKAEALVKDRAQIGGATRHFHLQITAAGLDAVGSDNELKLFRKIPYVGRCKPEDVTVPG